MIPAIISIIKNDIMYFLFYFILLIVMMRFVDKRGKQALYRIYSYRDEFDRYLDILDSLKKVLSNVSEFKKNLFQKETIEELEIAADYLSPTLKNSDEILKPINNYFVFFLLPIVVVWFSKPDSLSFRLLTIISLFYSLAYLALMIIELWADSKYYQMQEFKRTLHDLYILNFADSEDNDDSSLKK
ncbi:MAG TPA: hypothetical protein DGG95_14525 [Cytophagales bacterium]|nr:hypothetical protein [Cytophagales bacterium]